MYREANMHVSKPDTHTLSIIMILFPADKGDYNRRRTRRRVPTGQDSQGEERGPSDGKILLLITLLLLFC